MTNSFNEPLDNPFAAPESEILEAPVDSDRSSDPLVQASLFRRLGAALLDIPISYLLALAGFGITLNITSLWTDLVEDPPIQILLAFLLPVLVTLWLYFAFLETTQVMGTFGKRLFRIQVAQRDGSRIGLGQATCRFLIKIFTIALFITGLTLQPLLTSLALFLCIFTLIGFYIWAKMAPHDLLTGTLIIKKPNQTPSNPKSILDQIAGGSVTGTGPV